MGEQAVLVSVSSLLQVLVPFSGGAEHCRGNLQAKPTSDFGTGAEQEEKDGN